MTASANPPDTPRITICVLTFGDYAALARRVIESIRSHCPRHGYCLVVGANAVGQETLKFLTEHQKSGEIDRLIVSPTNLGKSGMMRRMFAFVETELIWWFDDDSYITEPGALARWLDAVKSSPESTVLWGRTGRWEAPVVRSASWYRGLPPPSWRPGGKGEFDLWRRGIGDGRWYFVSGGCFLIRTSAVRAMDWPDPRLFVVAEDIFLGEAVRQQGWNFADVLGVTINSELSRGVRK
jgi:GT2 family glycosyltransferase